MAKKKADKLGEVIVDKDGNKVSRAVVNAQLVSIMFLLLLWHVLLFIFHVPYSFLYMLHLNTSNSGGLIQK